MTSLHPDDRYHIELRLGREMTVDELAEARTFDDLSREQVAIVTRLGSQVTLSNAYVRAVVPSADRTDVRNFVLNIQDFIDEKFPPSQLAMEHFYVRELGRPLTDAERRRAASIPELSEAQVAVARQLSSSDRAIGLLYLRDVVKSAAIHEREAFVDALRRDDER